MYRVQSQRLPVPTRSAHTPTLRFPIPGTVQPGEASHADVTQHTWAWLVPNWSLQKEPGDPELLQTVCPLRISTPIWLSSDSADCGCLTTVPATRNSLRKLKTEVPTLCVREDPLSGLAGRTGGRLSPNLVPSQRHPAARRQGYG